MPPRTDSGRSPPRQIPFHFFEKCANLHRTAARARHFATMVLDKAGTVRYCNGEAARLFGTDTHNLLGQPIGTLIPDLPLKAATPGYNIAYARFAAADSRRRFGGMHCQGRRLGLDLSLDALVVEGQHQIVLNLHLPLQAFERSAPPVPRA